MSEIKDSGNRTEFSTGAVRDIQEGKGRMDLMPLDVIGGMKRLGVKNKFFHAVSRYMDENSIDWLYKAFEAAAYIIPMPKGRNVCALSERLANALLEVSIHMEEGAKKYGERNWEKGIPVSRYIDSACRHYLKHLRGDTDERHDRACAWNILCAIWTVKNKTEMDDITHGSDTERHTKKRSYWKWGGDAMNGQSLSECQNCGGCFWQTKEAPFGFCPDCGARMDGEG